MSFIYLWYLQPDVSHLSCIQILLVEELCVQAVLIRKVIII